jgi:hypothetical protein
VSRKTTALTGCIAKSSNTRDVPMEFDAGSTVYSTSDDIRHVVGFDGE